MSAGCCGFQFTLTGCCFIVMSGIPYETSGMTAAGDPGDSAAASGIRLQGAPDPGGCSGRRTTIVRNENRQGKSPRRQMNRTSEVFPETVTAEVALIVVTLTNAVFLKFPSRVSAAGEAPGWNCRRHFGRDPTAVRVGASTLLWSREYVQTGMG